jgi:hypothetical protein
MKRSILFMLLTAMFVLCGCKKETEERISGAVFSKSLVMLYIHPDEATYMEHNTKGGFTFSFDGERLYGKNPEFIKLSTQYGDTLFNRYTVPYVFKAIADSINSVEIICDKDIDANHKAGESLTDIFMLRALSPINSIKNEYKVTNQVDDIGLYDDTHHISSWYYYDAVEIKANEINAHNTRMFDPMISLKLDDSVKPASGEFTFTITFHFTNKDITSNVVAKY